jgi:hypothetical protein
MAVTISSGALAAEVAKPESKMECCCCKKDEHGKMACCKDKPSKPKNQAMTVMTWRV